MATICIAPWNFLNPHKQMKLLAVYILPSTAEGTEKMKNILEHDVFSIDSIMHSLNILILNETQLFS